MNVQNKIRIALVGALSATTLLANPAEAFRKAKTNIIYILADDLGRGELGCYGQREIETPNIDALAKAGMIFTNHYSGQAVSAPSRCSLLTGLHSGHAVIRGNEELASRGEVWNHKAMLADSTLEGQCPMPKNTVTVAHLLQRGGYRTACIGKWGLGYPGSESIPNKMGFDFFYGYICQRQAHTYYPPFLYRNEHREYLNNQLLPPGTKLDKTDDPYDERNYARFVQQDYAPDKMYTEVLNFVEQNKKRPFALFWTNPVPHVPLQAPKSWIEHYRGIFGEEKPFVGSSSYFPCRYPRATYAAMVSYFDEQIGGLVALLKKLNLYENTLIIFTSDNGAARDGGSDSPYFNRHSDFNSQNGWGKGSLREGGIRVPMIACWPKKIEAGSQTSLLSAFWDVLPTLCEVANVKPCKTDGISMLPTLLGKKRKQETHDYLYWEFPGYGGQKAVRMGNWKAYVGNIKTGNRKVELYDLKTDAKEQHNVAAKHPEIIKKVLEIFRNEHEEPAIENFQLPVW